ncbi:MAG: ankyrin repeat domain-containing protein [Burkholderiales bacterium]|nr:ankyrin repeat domain-containing protein [Burkholderiales bacterium]
MPRVAKAQSIVFALLGLGRGGKILYLALFVLAVPAFLAYTVWLPRERFSEADEQLFRAARHGDRGGIERALAEGARVSDVSPVDGKTALFRAAVFGHADALRLLLARGADPQARGSDGRTVLEVVAAARGDERDPAAAALDAVAAALREPGSGR